jgi:drug/metabolite transporter (DMT)-like permease
MPDVAGNRRAGRKGAWKLADRTEAAECACSDVDPGVVVNPCEGSPRLLEMQSSQSPRKDQYSKPLANPVGETCMLLVYVGCWYGTGVVFAVAFKLCCAYWNDIVFLTTLQFGVSAIFLSLGLPFAGGMAPLRAVMFEADLSELGCDETKAGEDPDARSRSIGTQTVQHTSVGSILHIKMNLIITAVLFLSGTLLTNISLDLLPIGVAHILKACEPLVTLVVLGLRKEMPELTSLTAAFCIVVGVIYSTSAQEGEMNPRGIFCILASNVCFQLRNILNKDALREEALSKSETEQQRPKPSPFHLLAALFIIALPFQLTLHAVKLFYQYRLSVKVTFQGHQLIMDIEPAEEQATAVYLNASAEDSHLDAGFWPYAWLILPPCAFAAYQLCSIFVLSKVHPLAHALVNTTRRGVIIGLGAYLTGEHLTLSYAFGAAVTLSGLFAFSISKRLTRQSSHRIVRASLILVICYVVVRESNELNQSGGHPHTGRPSWRDEPTDANRTAGTTPRHLAAEQSSDTIWRGCLRAIREKHVEAFGDYIGRGHVPTIFDPAVHTNVGDNLLWLGEGHLIYNFQGRHGGDPFLRSQACGRTQSQWRAPTWCVASVRTRP